MARLLRVLLGLFVLWQLLFLLTANGVALLNGLRPHLRELSVVRWAAPKWVAGEGPLQTATQSAEKVTSRWAEATGQPQRWSLFAPEVSPEVTFVAVELHWDEDREPVLLLSDNEPPDPGRYLRVGRFRLRRYESTVDVFPPEPDPETGRRTADGWNERIRDKVSSGWRSIHAYLRWRVKAYRRDHPDEPAPAEAVLLLRWYRVTEPGSDHAWDGPEQRPIARWRPGFEPGEEILPVERYNPVVERFEQVRREP